MIIFYKLKYKIFNLYYLIKHFIINIYVFRRTLASHRSWDYSGMLQAMEDALAHMISGGMPHIKNGHRHIKQMKVAKELCKRIREDSYTIDKIDYSHPAIFEDIEGSKFKRIRIISNKIFDIPNEKLVFSINYRKQDLDLLNKILNRNLFSWWD